MFNQHGLIFNQVYHTSIHEEASTKSLAEGIVNVLDATPDWPGTTIPVILTAILLRWPPSLVTTSDIDVLGEERGGKSDIEVEFDRVVENAYRNHRQLAEVASPVPRLDDYLRDVEFDWEKTIASWHNMIADARDTRIRPAPVVEQYWNAEYTGKLSAGVINILLIENNLPFPWTSIPLAEKASSMCHLYYATKPGSSADLLENGN
ncbi:hypothetical protein EIK77_008222 [Talaromyces pinophilus]|nr:hypothetical protein EIK77_008222 [Talaromyces pinophilus]